MNIFFLDKDPTIAAQYNCDKHVVKIILETCQMLEHKTWLNHPMTRWVNGYQENYRWTLAHAKALCEEYTFRYGKIHKWENKIRDLTIAHYEEKDPYYYYYEEDAKSMNPPLCMPEDCRLDDYVSSYRNYYLKYKQRMLKWTKREIPYWVLEEKCQVVTV